MLSNKQLNNFLFICFFVFSILLWPINLNFIGNFHIRLNEIFYLISALILGVSNQKISLNTKKLFLFTVPVIVFHYLFTSFLFCEDQHLKGIASLPVFLIMIFVGWELGQRSTNQNWLGLEKISLIVIILATLAILVEFAFPDLFPAQATYRIGGIYSGIYDEPSHLAFSIYPCILITLLSKRKIIFFNGVIFSIILAYLSPSSTYLLLLLIALFLALYKKMPFFLFNISVPITLVGFWSFIFFFKPQSINQLQIKLEGILSVGGNTNLSSLVYLQGWSDAIQNLTRTWGLGLGFNMMGCNPVPSNPSRSVISTMGLSGLNDFDGSFLFSKGTSELGIFFLILMLALSFISIKILNKKNYSNSRVNLIKLILISSFLATSITRTSGYFCGTFGYLVLALSGILTKENQYNEKKLK